MICSVSRRRLLLGSLHGYQCILGIFPWLHNRSLAEVGYILLNRLLCVFVYSCDSICFRQYSKAGPYLRSGHYLVLDNTKMGLDEISVPLRNCLVSVAPVCTFTLFQALPNVSQGRIPVCFRRLRHGKQSHMGQAPSLGRVS